jgi:Flp pilus assembly pilin Flp
MKILTALSRILRDDKGIESTEIALAIVLIALVAGLGMVEFGAELRDFFTAIAGELDDPAVTSIPPVPAAD